MMVMKAIPKASKSLSRRLDLIKTLGVLRGVAEKLRSGAWGVIPLAELMTAASS